MNHELTFDPSRDSVVTARNPKASAPSPIRRLLALLFVLSAAPFCPADEPEAERPNIIFIMVDDLGYADLSSFGSKTIQTPNIDRLATEGFSFTQCYSGCTVCAPARATLMTGKHMGHAAVRGNTGGIPLPSEEVTVAELLKQADYATGGFGKWGLGDIDTEGAPEKQGFDLFFGYYHQIHAHYFYPDYLVRNGKKIALPGNEGFYDDQPQAGFFPSTDPDTGKVRQYSQNLIFEETLDFIRSCHQDGPFFCYVPWTPPHGRYEFPADDPATEEYASRPWSIKAKVIAAMVSQVDRQVGALLDLLDELGIAEQTIVFFCSDHGAAERLDGELNSSGILKGRKRSMYEGGLRTPMLVRWPGRIAPGRRSDLPWYFPDFLPTCLDLANASDSLPEGIDGISVLPTLLNRGLQKRHPELYWEWPRYNWRTQQYTGLMQAIRMGDMKLLRHASDQAWELYNLATDPGETTDLAASYPSLVRRMSERIDRVRKPHQPIPEPEKPAGRRYR